jgi:lipopolysaccharide/colanic/teichoic acid biosynthesis glycosyltransferase
MYPAFIKPLSDFIISLILLIILSPLIVVIGLCIIVIIGKPVLFSQDRPGKREKIFRLYKFRTMTLVCSQNGVLLPDNERLTSLGSFLRKTSLDELPQLFNVLKGEVSLVGPRPLLVEYLSFYNERQKLRHNVKPGITGWAQVNGRNAITWEEKFELDAYYVEHVSFFLDIKIILRTLAKIVGRSDIYNSDGLTMNKFSGSKK